MAGERAGEIRRLEGRIGHDQAAAAGEARRLGRRPLALGGGDRQRQQGAEGRAHPDAGLRLDAPAHPRGEAAGDGEAEARALVAVGALLVALLEFLEQARQALLRDARPRIGDGHGEPVAAEGQGDADAAALGELDGVAGEVEQDLAEAVGIADQRGRHLGGDVEGDFQPLVLRAGRQKLHDALRHGGGVEGLGGEVEAPGLDPREIEDAVDQPEERLAARPHRIDIGLLLGSSPVPISRSVMPMMPFSGVRISWLTVARKRDFATLALSARARARHPAPSPPRRAR